MVPVTLLVVCKEEVKRKFLPELVPFKDSYFTFSSVSDLLFQVYISPVLTTESVVPPLVAVPLVLTIVTAVPYAEICPCASIFIG
ncbi:MAG: hypothetical protein IJH65_10975 [Methanobrevibacter sp.]|nr:hypothetical protein [Methanobrevibacter sp.]